MGIFEGVLAGLAFLIVILIFGICVAIFLDWAADKMNGRRSKRPRSRRT